MIMTMKKAKRLYRKDVLVWETKDVIVHFLDPEGKQKQKTIRKPVMVGREDGAPNFRYWARQNAKKLRKLGTPSPKLARILGGPK